MGKCLSLGTHDSISAGATRHCRRNAAPSRNINVNSGIGAKQLSNLRNKILKSAMRTHPTVPEANKLSHSSVSAAGFNTPA
jgi:hypothetical protein